MSKENVLDFWFQEVSTQQWFTKDPEFDQEIRRRFGDLHSQASAGELYQWRNEVHGRLAEIIVLDQFSRNIYRDQKGAFASDTLALALAQELVRTGSDRELSDKEVSFAYMPYMHSESPVIHQEAVQLYSSRPGLEYNLDYEHRHKKIIDRFGRYPHRNQILGRESTAEEIEFLKEDGSSF